MQTPLQIIEQLGAPTNSYVDAIYYLRYERKPMTRIEQATVISDVFGFKLTEFPDLNDKELEFLMLYSVQEAIRAFNTGIIPDMEDVWNNVQTRYTAFILENPWSIKDYADEETVDSEGDPKKKKGAKKELAKELYIKMNDGETERGDIITALIEEVGLSKPGATTYFHNLKSEYGFSGPATVRRPKIKGDTTPTPKAKKKRGPSKGQMARNIYNSMPGADKSDIVNRIVTETGTSPAGANTYYCAAKREAEND